MRIFSAIAFAGALGIAVPAFADTITYDVAFSFYQNGIGSQPVFGTQFNPALGTLTEVSAFVSGTYLPDITGASVPSSTTAVFYDEWSGDCSCGSGPIKVGTYSLTNGTGPAQAFSSSTGALGNLQSYIDVGGSPAFAYGFLLNVDAFSQPATPGAWGDWDDQSLYSGDVQITYTYTVPEPSSIAILAFGAGLMGLGGVWRRRGAVVAA